MGSALYFHGGYLHDTIKVADTGRLVLNAVRWTGKRKTPKVGVRGHASRTPS